jgi:hypothetical protein
MIEKDFVQSILAEMDPICRNVLLLSAEGYSRTEVARQLKFAESTVTTYLSRARKEFRHLYYIMSNTTDGSSKKKNGAEAHNASKPESLDEEGRNPDENRKEI